MDEDSREPGRVLRAAFNANADDHEDSVGGTVGGIRGEPCGDASRESSRDVGTGVDLELDVTSLGRSRLARGERGGDGGYCAEMCGEPCTESRPETFALDVRPGGGYDGACKASCTRLATLRGAGLDILSVEESVYLLESSDKRGR